MGQQLMVALIVLCAAVYAGARYLPSAWRLRLVNRLSRGGAGSPLVRLLDTGASCGSGCKTCQTCATPAALAAPASASAKGRRVIVVHDSRTRR
jgi:hypothetical protein